MVIIINNANLNIKRIKMNSFYNFRLNAILKYNYCSPKLISFWKLIYIQPNSIKLLKTNYNINGITFLKYLKLLNRKPHQNNLFFNSNPQPTSPKSILHFPNQNFVINASPLLHFTSTNFKTHLQGISKVSQLPRVNGTSRYYILIIPNTTSLDCGP